nr:phenylacetaldoxime dehydratase family protein [Nocardia miyunensis]
MESAIDTHLQCPRTLSRRVPDDYEPPFPMFVARADESLEQVVMAYLGVQHAQQSQRPAALAALRDIVGSFESPDGPIQHDLTHHIDNQDHHNLMVVAYWADAAAFCRWLRSDAVTGWWESEDRLTEGLGYFREILAPRAEQLETLYAFTEDFPGVGGIMRESSGEISEHGYWGSMRDRIPLSQTDWLKPTDELSRLGRSGPGRSRDHPWPRQHRADPIRSGLARSRGHRARTVLRGDPADSASRYGLPA